MTSKHTPGPWRYDFDGDDFPIVGRPTWECTRYGVKGEWSIALVHCLGEESQEDGNEAEANARLIAAAPELLEALKLAHDYLCGDGWEDDERLKPINEALSKAEGE